MNKDKLLNVSIDNRQGNGVLGLRVGSDIIGLNDETKSTFRTGLVSDFIRFVKRIDKTSVLFFDPDNLRVEAYMPNDLNMRYNTEPIAVCSFSLHPVLLVIRQANQRAMDLAGFEIFLKKVEPYLDADSLLLKDIVTNLSIQKVVSVNRQKDNRGNFTYTVKSEKGKNDFKFPDKLNVTIPVLFGVQDKMSFSFDFVFSYSIEDGGVGLNFSMNNLMLDYEIEEKAEILVREKFLIKEFDESQFFVGQLKKQVATNEWRYRENPLTVKD